MSIKQVIKLICPPIMVSVFQKGKKLKTRALGVKASDQNLGMYWDADFAKVLDTWGEGNVWNEIQFLLASREGKVLDIACGTGKTMEIVSKFANIELYGCGISDLLIAKAAERGIPEAHLAVCDATKLPYQDNEFKFAYSIGSIEHFTEDGIEQFLRQCYRTVSDTSFHQHPVSRSGINEGWVTTTQSYYNNSVEWWLEKYRQVYGSVYVLDSVWDDEISLGKWFVCKK